MKTSILLIFTTLVVSSLALSDSQKEKLWTFGLSCQKEAGLSDEIRNKLRNLEFVEDSKVNKHILCVWKKLGLANEDGDIVEAKLHERVKASTLNDQEAKKFFEKCMEVYKDTHEETVFEVNKCLFTKLPNLSIVE